MTSGQRILVNALATYGRTLLAIFLGLFSSRWVLAALGEIDYGLMGVVGGILVFITFLNRLSTNAAARYFAFSVGKNDVEETRRWFNTALSFEMILPALLVTIGFFAGEWAIKHFLSIPPDRLTTSIWVFRISLATALVTMVCSPFMAMYTAKQNIAELSLWGMGLSICSFTFAYILIHMQGDRWLIFSLGTGIITCTFCILQSIRSHFKYEECKIVFAYWLNTQRLKDMTSYSCWTLFGTLGGIFNSVGMGIVLNKFFPPIQFPSVNASYSIGSTVCGHTQNVSSALSGAFTPEIVSSEGRGDRSAVIRNVFRVQRLSFIIISIIAIPILLEIDFILKVWLQNPPEFASLFCRTLLIAFLLRSFVNGFNPAIAATGKIRNYQVVNSSFAYLSICVAAFVLWLGAGLYGLCAVIVIYNLVDMLGNLYFCKKLVGISVRVWFKTVVTPVIVHLLINLFFGILLFLVTSQLSEGAQFFIVSISVVVSTAYSSWWLLIDNSEKEQCKNLWANLKSKISKLCPF